MCVCCALAWTIFGLLAWRSSDSRDTARRLFCAVGFWTAAVSIKGRWTARARYVTYGVWLLAAFGAMYWMGR